MIHDADELRALLATTSLAGAHVMTLPILDTGDHSLLVEIDPASVLASWRAVRGLMHQTGRWPVAVSAAGGAARSSRWQDRLAAEDLFSRFYFKEGADGLDVSPAGLARRAWQIDLPAALAADERLEVEIDPLEEAIEPALEYTERVFGSAPSVEDVASAILDGRPLASAADLDRWLARWERESFPQRVLGRRETDPAPWFEPPDACALCLLPTTDGAEGLAYLAWYAGSGRDDAELIALLRSWQTRFGAELVAHWGTMLQLVVSRPPRDEESAWVLAREQTLVAPYTILGPGTPLREHARSLIGSERWFLHERP